ncbi:MAG: MFS transporter [Proteobacteria bacterium]|jgi:GPH family glycoside/pentoside/hexuronide:cation symporter|nr:MFS transporter [Pseudomonadota bacterium]
MIKTTLNKIYYGSLETGINAIEVFLRLHLLVFYSQTLGLSATSVGVALSIGILWDAITDPLVGNLSDRFQARYHTRWPLVLAGGVFTVLLLWLLFNPPSDLKLDLWWYLLICCLGLNTATTFLGIPYTAMVGDLTSDSNERGQYIGWRLAFSNLGAILGIGIPGYFLAQENPAAYSASSVSILLVLLGTLAFSSLTKVPRVKVPRQTSLARIKFPRFWENFPFLWLVSGFFIVNVGLAFNSAAALFFYRLRVQYQEAEIQKLLLLFLIVFTASIPLWISLAKKWEKKPVLISGALLLGISNCLIYPLLPVGEAFWGYFWAATVGGVFVGSSVLMESLLTDTIEYGNRQSQSEAFGFYFGAWKFFGKASRAVAVLIAGVLLDWAQVNTPQPFTEERLAWIFGPGVGLFFLLGALMIIPLKLKPQTESSGNH